MNHIKRTWPAYSAAGLFILLGSTFINQPGIEEDEAMFATALFRDWVFFALHFGQRRLPLMHMSYVGALKTWLCAPVFWIWPPTPTTIRMPAVILGGASILLFWFFLERVHSRRAAIAGCILLATDTIYLITDTLDWGPVAIQHVLTIAAMLFAVRWVQDGKPRYLYLAAFSCGLAFWDKAIFAWMFAGLCSGLLIFAPRILRRLTIRTAALAAASFLIGALPLVIYNVQSDPKFATFRSNAKFSPPNLAQGFQALRRTWNGSGLFGIVQSTASRPNPPRNAIERGSIALHAVTGNYQTNPTEVALIIALLWLPFLWRTPARDPMLFAIIAMAVAWAVMIICGGGLSPHHTILIWPLPVLFLAVSIAEFTKRSQLGPWLLAASVVLLAGTNLLVTNQYLYQFARFGASDAWTDAISPLAASLAKTHASQAVVIDWGIADQLCVLNQNDPPPHPISMPFNDADLPVLADEKAIWVEHTTDHEIFKGVNEAARTAAEKHGYKRTEIETIYDRNGRAIFKTFRISKPN